MSWITLGILCAFTTAVYQLYSKKLLQKYSQITIVFYSSLFGTFLFIPFLIFYGIPEIDIWFLISLLFFSALFFTTSFLILTALKNAPISEVLPLLSMTPLFTILTSFIMLKQVPSIYGVVGILLIIIGYYVLSTNTSKFELATPIKALFTKKESFFMLLASFLLSILANVYKIGVEHSNEFFFLTWGYGLVTIIAFLILISKKKLGKTHINKHFISLGILWGLIDIFYIFAIRDAIVPYVISIKRLSVLLGVFLGIIAFKEKNFAIKILGTAIMLAGTLVIILMI